MLFRSDLLQDLHKLIQGRLREIPYARRDNSITIAELFGELRTNRSTRLPTNGELRWNCYLLSKGQFAMILRIITSSKRVILGDSVIYLCAGESCAIFWPFSAENMLCCRIGCGPIGSGQIAAFGKFLLEEGFEYLE